jgi:WD40 repeat protein/tRNA A-37 threonylcarbamoyl transferase component Bud32
MVAYEPDTAVPGPPGATVAGGDLDRPDPDIGTPAAAAASFGPADPTSVTMAGDTLPTVVGSVGPEAGPSDLGTALASEPSFGPPPDPSAATGPSAAPPDGTHRTTLAIPGYEILGELGRGGMGVVYQARQVRLNRAVALKMILAGAHAGAEATARFLAEAEAVAQFQHPHIVQIYHIDEHAGLPYFEMEFVGGGNLADRLDGAPRPAGAAARLVETLAGAMAEAHRHGIVHRDLKPGNILLTPEGTPKVADFGLAKLLNVESGLTRTDSVLGSPSYMAPEQAGGKAKDVGPAADVYALGAILYELLTGRPPFRGTTVLETLEHVKTADPVPPSRLVPGLPRDAETIALRCLQKDPARRYESAAALAEDLRRYQAGEPIVARPVGSAERAWRWCRRNRVLASLMAAVATLLVAVALGTTLAALRFRALSQTLESNLYFSDIALAHRQLSRDNLRRALERLEECPPQLRQWEWYYLKRLCRVDPVIFRDENRVNTVAFSLDGELLASAGSGGTVKVRNARTGEVVRTRIANTESIYSVAFHPGGKHLAFTGVDRQARVWDLTTGQEIFTCNSDADNNIGTAYGVAFSPDGRQLAVGSGGAVQVWDWRNCQLLLTLPGHAQRPISVAFSRDGRRLASGNWSGEIMIWDAETGERLRTLSGHHQPVSALTFSPDGRRLVSACFDQRLIVWEVTTGHLLRAIPQAHEGLVLGVAFSPDGRRLASSGQDKMVRIWEAATGREVLEFRGHTDLSGCVAYSPDGLRLASASRDATIRLWDATPLHGDEDQGVLTFSQLDGEVWTMAINPDGQRIASAGMAAGLDMPVKVWDLRTGQVSVELTGHSMVVFRVAWHPDGQRIASSGWDQQQKGFVVKVWDARTGRQAFALPAGAETFVVAFSPGGQHLFTGEPHGIVQVWDAQTFRKVGALATHGRGEIRGLAFSPDGRQLALASLDGTVELWDATRLGEKQEARRILPAWVPLGFTMLAFSPDGRRLVVGGEENTVKIWDVTTGGVLQTIRGHSGEVLAAAFSPDPEGRWVASAGEDSTVKVWDSHTGTLVRSFRGHMGYVSGVAFSPDGRLLVSASHDRTVKVWDLSHLEGKKLKQ